ncbi:PIN domain-containing protein [Campylobacter concisus]|uniref:PIN domain-containing protein n=3 Tax=Campylobacter concisus TaxID=199 RepID=UPI0015E1AFA5|nr:PIN domain-containing protein [Campylobacter concisus]
MRTYAKVPKGGRNFGGKMKQESNIEQNNTIKYVFLDTNIFVAANYNYKTGSLYNFFENAKKYGIGIYITSVVDCEIKKQIKKFSSEYYKQTNAIVSSGIVESNIESEKNDITAESIENTMLSYYDEVLKKYGITITPCYLSEVDTENLMYMHYEKQNPFSGKKPSEFKDGITLINIQNFINKNNIPNNVVFATTDLECIGFCKDNNIKYCNQISKVSNTILIQNDTSAFLEQIKDLVDSKLKSFFDSKIIDYYIDTDIWNSDSFVEIKDEKTAIDRVDLIKYFVSNIDSDKDGDNVIKILDISVDFKLSLTIETYPYGDDNTASHDREDGCDQWFFNQYVETTFNEEISIKDSMFRLYYSMKDEDIINIEQDKTIDIMIQGYIGDFRDRDGSIDNIIYDDA